MSDIHLKLEEDGISMWRTVRVANGGKRRVKGSFVQLGGKSGINEELPVFQPEDVLEALLGESNANSD